MLTIARTATRQVSTLARRCTSSLRSTTRTRPGTTPTLFGRGQQHVWFSTDDDAAAGDGSQVPLMDQRPTPLSDRLGEIETFIDDILDELEEEDDTMYLDENDFQDLEEDATYDWAEEHGYMSTAVEYPKQFDEEEGFNFDDDREEVAFLGDVHGTASGMKFEDDFDNFHDFEEIYQSVKAIEDVEPDDKIFQSPDAGAAKDFTPESRELLDDILAGASADARASVERLVRNVYGPENPARFLADMRTPKLADDVIDPNHWAAPLLQQYLRVLDANPYYSPSQIETQLSQFARELSTEYYEDTPYQVDEETELDDMPKADDEEEQDEGYLN